MIGEKFTQQPEVNAIQSEKEGLVLQERERHLEEASRLIRVVEFGTIGVKNQDGKLVAVSEVNTNALEKDLNKFKDSDVWMNRIIRPTWPISEKILAKISLLKEFGKVFGNDQGIQADLLREILVRIRLSTNEEETENLTKQAKDIFFNNVERLLNSRSGIDEEQDKFGTLCRRNSDELKANLKSRLRFVSEEEGEMVKKGPVGNYVDRSVEQGEETVPPLVKESLEADYDYRVEMADVRDKFAKEMDSLVPKK